MPLVPAIRMKSAGKGSALGAGPRLLSRTAHSMGKEQVFPADL